MPKASGHLAGRNADGSVRRSSDTTTETLADLGISKDQSSLWQKLGAIPQEDFELAIGTSVLPPTAATDQGRLRRP